jgi:hypothetical protein
LPTSIIISSSDSSIRAGDLKAFPLLIAAPPLPRLPRRAKPLIEVFFMVDEEWDLLCSVSILTKTGTVPVNGNDKKWDTDDWKSYLVDDCP